MNLLYIYIFKKNIIIYSIPVDPVVPSFLGSVWALIWVVSCAFAGGVWIHRVLYIKYVLTCPYF